MLDNLYENIGGKIKNWAKWIFIVEAIGSIITAFVLPTASGDPDDFILISFLIAILGPLVAWVSSWLLYAFGEMVEDIHAMRTKYYPLAEEEEIRKAEEKARIEAEEKARREAEEREKQEAEKRAKFEVKIPEEERNEYREYTWICGKCKKENMNSRETCWYCNNPQE